MPVSANIHIVFIHQPEWCTFSMIIDKCIFMSVSICMGKRKLESIDLDRGRATLHTPFSNSRTVEKNNCHHKNGLTTKLRLRMSHFYFGPYGLHVYWLCFYIATKNQRQQQQQLRKLLFIVNIVILYRSFILRSACTPFVE